MKKLAVLMAVAAMGSLAFCEEADAGNGGMLQRLGRDSEHGLSLVGRDRPGAREAGEAKKSESKELAKQMSDFEDSLVFVKICDGEEMTWGELHGEVDALLDTNMADLTAALGNGEGIAEIRLSLYQQSISRLLQAYIRSGVVAQEAKKQGISFTDEEIAKEIAEYQAKSKKKRELSSLQKKILKNEIYQKAYVDKYIRPGIKADDAVVAELIRKRHEVNLSVPATNAMFRAQMEELRGRLERNELSWGEAAEEYSECPDCGSDDGDCGTWEEDEDDRNPELLKVCFSIATNTVSEVIETPDAFHLIKVTSRYEPSAKGREEDGEVSTADVRHIQLDKWQVDPEYTEETAREFVESRMIRKALKVKQNELINSSKIESVIPLKGEKKRQGTKRVFNKM